MFHRVGHPKELRIFNLVFVFLSLIFAIVWLILSEAPIYFFFIANSFVLINLVFLFVGHHQLISLLKCRFCFIYIWFSIIALNQIFGIVALLYMSVDHASGNRSGYKSNFSQSLLWILLVYLIVSFIQGLSCVLYTRKLAHHFVHEL